MTGAAEIVRETRRLADTDVGSSDWVQNLVVAVRSADDQDLGLMVVARVALAHAEEQRAAEVARQAEAAEEHRREQQRERTEARRAALSERRQQRHQHFRDEVWMRLVLSAIYSGIAAIYLRYYGPDDFWTSTLSVFAVCLVAVACSLLFDWFAHSEGVGIRNTDPAGPIRAWTVFGGVLVGLFPFPLFVANLVEWRLDSGQWLFVGPISVPWVVAFLPLSISVSWMIGGLLSILAGPPAGPTLHPRVTAAQRFLFPVVLIGPVGAASSIVLALIPASFALGGVITSPRVIPFWDVGITGNHMALVAFCTAPMVLHHAAQPLLRRWEPAGIAVCVAAPLLGFVTIFTNPFSIVRWLLDSAIRSLF